MIIIDHHEHCLQRPRFYSMLIGDLTFRTLAAAAEADEASALHSPIIMRGLVHGYAATQGLAIRRLVDKRRGVISPQKLLDDIRNHICLFTRENFVSGEGLPYDHQGAMQELLTRSGTAGGYAPNTGSMAFVHSMQAHAVFDQLAGTQSGSRTDKIPKRLIGTIERWLKVQDIEEVVEWTNMRIAHAADQESCPEVNLAALAPTLDKISKAQRNIVRTTEAVSAYLLRGPTHMHIVPVLQYSQFHRFEMVVRDPQVVKRAQQRWRELTHERDAWTQGLLEELTGKCTP
jgi:hypothetical protein